MGEEVQKQLKQMRDEISKLKGEVAQAKANNSALSSNRNATTEMKIATSIPLPKEIRLSEGDVTANFKYFKSQWTNYVTASGLGNSDENVKKATLLSIIGEECHRRYENLPLNEEEKATAESMLKALEKYLTPKKNVRYERAIFNMAKQEDDESYDAYINRLRGLIKTCEYKELEDDLLLDKIIYSVKSITLREQLWTNNTISLDEAINKCRSKELFTKQMKEVSDNGKEDESGAAVNKIRKSTRNDQRIELIDCGYCGTKHERKKTNCPAFGKKCLDCGIKNHFAAVCRNKDKEKRKRVKETTFEDDDSDTSTILQIGEGTLKGDLFVKISNGDFKKTKCVLDTGSEANVIGKNNLKKIFDYQPIRARKTKTILKSFGGKRIPAIGRVDVECKRRGKIYKIQFQVVEHDHMPLLSNETSRQMGYIKVCSEIQQVEDAKREAKNIVKEYSDVFEGLGCFEGKVKLEVDEKATPKIQRPRRIALAFNKKLKECLDDMEKSNVICKEEKHTDWVSNILFVQRNGKSRICLDPLELNKALKSVEYPIPTVEEILPELNEAMVFSTVDAKRGFWQVELDEESSKMCTFFTPYGRYRFLRMPFGIAPAMEIYQRKQNEILHGLNGIAVIADDILICGKGKTIEEATADHNRNFRSLLQRLREKNCKLNKDKIKLCQSEVKFFGNILTQRGLKSDPTKVFAINNMPTPTNKAELTRFLGMVTYLSKFVPNLSDRANGLRHISNDGVEWKWEISHQNDFDEIKKLITTTPVLKYFDVNKPIVIQADASDFALGACIMQDGLPISYASKVLTSAQRSYAQIEKEMLSILFACRRFDQYICGKNDVMVETDHQPLIRIAARNQLSDAPKRLQAMLLALQRYNLKLKYTKGSEMHIADFLSRAPTNPKEYEREYEIYAIHEYEEKYMKRIEQIDAFSETKVCDKTMARIKKATQDDATMMKLIEVIKNGWPNQQRQLDDELKQFWKLRDDLTVNDNIILKTNRIFVPLQLRNEMLERLHAYHVGIENTTKLARQTVYWPGIGEQIKSKIKNCETCLKYAPNQQNPPMMSHEIPTQPWERISMDVMETAIGDKKKRFLITVDHYSDFFEIDELNDLSARATIKICKQNFSRHGKPKICVTDGGTNFKSNEFERFAADWEFEIVHSSPHHQQGNGKAESAVKMAKNLIKKSIDSKGDFWLALLQWRNTPNKTDYSPVQRLFSRKTRCNIPSMSDEFNPKVPEDVKQRIEANRNRAKQQYDKHVANLPKLKSGDKVMAKIDPKSSKWEKAEIREEIKPNSFTVVTKNNVEYRRSRVHIKQLPKMDESPNESESNDETSLDEQNTNTSTDQQNANTSTDQQNANISTDQQNANTSPEKQTKKQQPRNNQTPIYQNQRPQRNRRKPDRYGSTAHVNQDGESSIHPKQIHSRRNTHI